MMRGLWVKDLKLMWAGNKTVVGILVGLTVWFSCLGKAQMALGYVVILLVFISIGTLKYDEFNHGLHFLFTLPFERKEYVREKYLLGILMAAAGAAFSFLVNFACSVIMQRPIDDTLFVAVVVIFLIGVLMLAVMLPVQFKFGAEKGSIVTKLLGIGIAGLSLLAANFSADSETAV